MTLWKQGASAVPVLARLRIIFGSAGIGIGGMLPIGTALVTEFAPRRIRATMIVMGVVGVALGGGLGRNQHPRVPPTLFFPGNREIFQEKQGGD